MKDKPKSIDSLALKAFALNTINLTVLGGVTDGNVGHATIEGNKVIEYKPDKIDPSIFQPDNVVVLKSEGSKTVVDKIYNPSGYPLYQRD